MTTHCYDAPAGVIGKLGNKLVHELPERLQWKHLRDAATDRAISALDRVQPDLVIVVKGDQLADKWWDAVKRSAAKPVLWLYDELARMDYDVESLRELGPVVSYSPHDVGVMRAAGVHAEFVPDAHDSLLKFEPVSVPGISFVGARYPNREALLREVAQHGSAEVFVYGREWSRHLWDMVRTRRFDDSGVTAGRDVSRPEYYGIMRGSVATLNMHGDGHDGFSMRTFEAPGVGGLSLIDKEEVAQFYDIGTETLVFRDSGDVLEAVKRAAREPAWADAIRVAGARKTLAKHTFVHRVAQLEKLWA
ncbi:CgeB family protein [Pseudoclavibacter helvolus]|uniref:CgeB family protein n=1 Tax=Pseudoclavibacter helvolus TaxID=255205 RepID=UPI001FC9A8A5|nr:glycosyltransferase [Pseudoclavibacter helvolus]